MNDPQKLERIREFFVKGRFAMDSGATIKEVSDGYAKCSLEIQLHHLDAANTVMDGAIFTLADFTFAVISNWNKPLHISTASQIAYLGVAKGSRLTAQAHEVKESRSTCYYLVGVTDDLDNAIAHVTASGLSKG